MGEVLPPLTAEIDVDLFGPDLFGGEEEQEQDVIDMWDEMRRCADEDDMIYSEIDVLVAAGLHRIDPTIYMERDLGGFDYWLYKDVDRARSYAPPLKVRCRRDGAYDPYGNHSCFAPSREIEVIRTMAEIKANKGSKVIVADPELVFHAKIDEMLAKQVITEVPYLVKRISHPSTTRDVFVDCIMRPLAYPDDLGMATRQIEGYNYLGSGTAKLETLFLFHNIRLGTSSRQVHMIDGLLTEFVTLLKKYHPEHLPANLEQPGPNVLRMHKQARHTMFDVCKTIFKRNFLIIQNKRQSADNQLDRYEYSRLWWGCYLLAHGMAGLLTNPEGRIEDPHLFHHIAKVEPVLKDTRPPNYRSYGPFDVRPN